MRLSILIATVPEREAMFNTLIAEFNSQILNTPVELVVDDRPRGVVSIGRKRQELLNRAQGEYIVYFDDDDFPRGRYVNEILTALEQGPDCVGFKIHMTTNGLKPQVCIHSLRNPVWQLSNGVFLRNVTHFNPVKRSLALMVGFQDLRFGEDKIYSDKISKLCKKEIFIDRFLFDYRYTNKEPHNKKYGIK